MSKPNTTPFERFTGNIKYWIIAPIRITKNTLVSTKNFFVGKNSYLYQWRLFNNWKSHKALWEREVIIIADCKRLLAYNNDQMPSDPKMSLERHQDRLHHYQWVYDQIIQQLNTLDKTPFRIHKDDFVQLHADLARVKNMLETVSIPQAMGRVQEALQATEVRSEQLTDMFTAATDKKEKAHQAMLEAVRQEYEKKMESFFEENASLLRINQKLSLDSTKIGEARVSLTKEIKTRDDKIYKLTADLHQTQEQLKESKNKVKELADGNERLIAEKVQLDHAHLMLQQNHDKITQENIELQRRVTYLTNCDNQSKAKITLLEKEKEDLLNMQNILLEIRKARDGLLRSSKAAEAEKEGVIQEYTKTSNEKTALIKELRAKYDTAILALEKSTNGTSHVAFLKTLEKLDRTVNLLRNTAENKDARQSALISLEELYTTQETLAFTKERKFDEMLILMESKNALAQQENTQKTDEEAARFLVTNSNKTPDDAQVAATFSTNLDKLRESIRCSKARIEASQKNINQWTEKIQDLHEKASIQRQKMAEEFQVAHATIDKQNNALHAAIDSFDESKETYYGLQTNPPTSEMPRVARLKRLTPQGTEANTFIPTSTAATSIRRSMQSLFAKPTTQLSGQIQADTVIPTPTIIPSGSQNTATDLD